MSGPEFISNKDIQPNEGRDTKIPVYYADVLSGFLKARRMTSAALAELIGCDASYTRRWVRGDRYGIPGSNNKYVSRIYDVLGLSEEEKGSLETAQKYSLLRRAIDDIGITLDEAKHFIDSSLNATK